MKNLFEAAKWIWQESACGVNETVDFVTEFTAEKADKYDIFKVQKEKTPHGLY